jgi:hypothetical protein
MKQDTKFNCWSGKHYITSQSHLSLSRSLNNNHACKARHYVRVQLLLSSSESVAVVARSLPRRPRLPGPPDAAQHQETCAKGEEQREVSVAYRDEPEPHEGEDEQSEGPPDCEHLESKEVFSLRILHFGFRIGFGLALG